MKEVRDLLMDIRIELRLHVRDFHKTDLCRRIDDARDLLHKAPAAQSGVQPASVEAADRVAQAWQGAAEDVRTTAPAFYELLAKKVALRLAALPPLAAPAAVDDVVDAAAAADAAHPAAVTEPELVPVAAISSTQGTIDGHIPSVETLQAIAASKRRFTEVQREWCVGEAMVRSGFNIDPEEFIARGDNEMARYLLDTVEEPS